MQKLLIKSEICVFSATGFIFLLKNGDNFCKYRICHKSLKLEETHPRFNQKNCLIR